MELSVEEKAQRHDEALVNTTRLWECGDISRETLEYIFPELKESEDEKIRRVLIQETKGSEERLFEAVTNEEFIAWLEKKGEQNLANSAKTCKDEQNTNVVIPKFRVGDVIHLKDSCVEYTIKSISDGHYYGKGFSFNIVGCDRDYELVEHNSAWSKEDEQLIEEASEYLRKYANQVQGGNSKVYVQSIADRIESLKDRVQPRQEWSEEDDQYLLVCKNALEKYQTTDKWDAKIISRWLEDKLKSLRPQTTWKPSDEQMKALKKVILCGTPVVGFGELSDLYEDLKKLREE